MDGLVLYAMSIIVSIILVLCLALLFVGLPGIWASIAIAGVWAFCVDAQAMLSFSFFIPIILMATMAEVAEFCISYYGTKKFGWSSKGGLAGIIGGFIGAIFGAAFLFGLVFGFHVFKMIPSLLDSIFPAFCHAEVLHVGFVYRLESCFDDVIQDTFY